MIYIIIGATNAGKSSLTRNTFLSGRRFWTKRDLMPITETDDCYIIGRYDTKERRVGTDTTSRTDIGLYADQVRRLIGSGKDIVLEGMRCVSRPMMNVLVHLGQEIHLIWVRATPKTSYERTKGSISFKVVQQDWTKCRNFISDYKNKVKCTIIDTDAIADFTTFKLDCDKYRHED